MQLTHLPGPRFNPFGKAHGGPTDEERQVGDLGAGGPPAPALLVLLLTRVAATAGNIEAGADGVAKVHIEDLHVKLIGPLSVIGRSIVVYEGEDDLGKVRAPAAASAVPPSRPPQRLSACRAGTKTL